MSRAILLVGSPKPGASASRAIGETLLRAISERGWETAVERVPTVDPTGNAAAGLAARASAFDLVILSFPVYVDTLPSPVTRLLEAWADAGPLAGQPAVAAIAQCGFPEAIHTEPALAACRSFARHAGLRWAGGIGLGMGGSAGGGDISRTPLGRLLPQFDAAGAALASGRPIPDEVTAAFARPIFPRSLYLLMGGLNWRLEARKHRPDVPLRHRRYAQ